MRSLIVLALLCRVAAAVPMGWECDQYGRDDRARSLEDTCTAVRGAATFIWGRAGVSPGEQTATAVAELDALTAGMSAKVSRSVETVDGHATAEMVFAMPNGDRGHARVVAEGQKLEAGLCVGPAAAISECEDRLQWISIAVKPHENADVDVVRWLEIVLVGAVVIGCAIATLRRMRRERSLVDSQPLRDLEVVTVSGVVRALGEPVIAPLSGTACVAYRARGRVFSGDGVPVLLGEPVEASEAPFAVETPRGTLVVDAMLEMALSPVSTRDEAREHAFLARHKLGAREHGGTMFEEATIAAGATVMLRGVVHLELDASATDERGYRDDAPAIAKLVGIVVILDVWT